MLSAVFDTENGHLKMHEDVDGARGGGGESGQRTARGVTREVAGARACVCGEGVFLGITYVLRRCK